MALQHFSLETGQETLLAVALGAVLATAGGFLAGQFERALHRRERERNAALLFGEVLSSLKLAIELSDASRGRGDPYGMVTLRMVRAAQRETDTYNRNREVLFDLRQSAVRAKIHSVLVRMILALDGVLSAYDAINEADLALKTGVSDQARAAYEARIEAYARDRAFAFDYAVALAAEIPDLLTALNPTAHYSFEAHEHLVRESMGLNVSEEARDPNAV
jgi:hypothetical protein